MSNENNEEIEKFEALLLDWMRTVTIFFIAGIALYHFTIDGKPYAVIAFLITILMVTTLIVDYILRRNEITSKGHEVRLPVDILVISMVLGLVLILWVTFDVIRLPYNISPIAQAMELESIPDATD
jgi:uncharacterized membrane protein YidH (DUF202 family)